MGFLEIAMAIIAPSVLVGVSALAIMALSKLFSWLSAKIQYDKIQGIFSIVEQAITSTVSELSNTAITDLQAKAADGKLTMDEAKDTLDIVIAKAKALVGPKFEATIDNLGIAFGDLALALLAKYLFSL